MAIYRFQDLKGSTPDLRLAVHIDEQPGEGNSAPTVLVFSGVKNTTRKDQEVEIRGTWERATLARALRWAADRLEGIPEEPS